MALEIKPTKAYKTDLKKYKNNEKVANRLKIAVDLLINGNPLQTDYRDHIYVGGYRKYKNVRDCHILPDCVLLYTKTSDSLILIRLGNHGSIVESLKKLRISEDTACIASKTSYIDEDGLDKNGIYYFGKKPKPPVNWKDYKKGDIKNFNLKERSDRKMKLSIQESFADDNGIFMQMDDVMDGLIGNVDDGGIDEVVKYYSAVSRKLDAKNRYSEIYCYFSNESWIDPLENKSDFDLVPVYKNGKYESYVCNSKYGKFIVDHFSDNFDFTMYALDESIIDNVLKDIELKYE